MECFISLLFEWSRAWGFTTSTTVVHFLSSFVFNAMFGWRGMRGE